MNQEVHVIELTVGLTELLPLAHPGVRAHNEDVEATLPFADAGERGCLVAGKCHRLKRGGDVEERQPDNRAGADYERHHDQAGDGHHEFPAFETLLASVTGLIVTPWLAGFAHGDVLGTHALTFRCFFIARRAWDSNPRGISAHWFSRPAPSAARTALRRTSVREQAMQEPNGAP